MSNDVYRDVKRLEAKIKHLEEFCHELSNYISDMQHSSNDKSDLLTSQINTFTKEVRLKIEKLEEKDADLNSMFSGLYRDNETDFDEIECRLESLEGIGDSDSNKYGKGRKSQVTNEVRDKKGS